MPRFFIEVPHAADQAECLRAVEVFFQHRLPFPDQRRLGLLGRGAQGVDHPGGGERGAGPVCRALPLPRRRQDRAPEQVHSRGYRGDAPVPPGLRA
jgi:hypothetical protein